MANNSLSCEIPEFELISRIYRMILIHSALLIQYPRRFVVIIFKKDNRSPVDRDQVTKIRVYRIIQFLHIQFRFQKRGVFEIIFRIKIEKGTE